MSAKLIRDDKGKVYRSFQSGHFSGYIEAPEVPLGQPYAAYLGSPIPWPVMHQVVAWCRKHPKDEVVVRLYRKDQDWKAVPWPQRHGTGMTVNELPDDPGVAAAQAEVTDWEMLGTVHHHCSGSAFQSGTDHGDEKTKPGIHITLGKVDKPVMDFHARVSVSAVGELGPDGAVVHPAVHCFYNADLTDWFPPPEGCEGVPFEYLGKIIEHMIVRIPEGAYPAHWDDRLIKWSTGTWSGGGGEWKDGKWVYPDGEYKNGQWFPKKEADSQGGREVGFGRNIETPRLPALPTSPRAGGDPSTADEVQLQADKDFWDAAKKDFDALLEEYRVLSYDTAVDILAGSMTGFSVSDWEMRSDMLELANAYGMSEDMLELVLNGWSALDQLETGHGNAS